MTFSVHLPVFRKFELLVILSTYSDKISIFLEFSEVCLKSPLHSFFFG